jgi:hypothetical protein
MTVRSARWSGNALCEAYTNHYGQDILAYAPNGNDGAVAAIDTNSGTQARRGTQSQATRGPRLQTARPAALTSRSPP